MGSFYKKKLPQGQLGPGVDLVDVVVARVVQVVADAGHQQDQHLQLAQPLDQVRVPRDGVHLERIGGKIKNYASICQIIQFELISKIITSFNPLLQSAEQARTKQNETKKNRSCLEVGVFKNSVMNK